MGPLGVSAERSRISPRKVKQLHDLILSIFRCQTHLLNNCQLCSHGAPNTVIGHSCCSFVHFINVSGTLDFTIFHLSQFYEEPAIARRQAALNLLASLFANITSSGCCATVSIGVLRVPCCDHLRLVRSCVLQLLNPRQY